MCHRVMLAPGKKLNQVTPFLQYLKCKTISEMQKVKNMAIFKTDKSYYIYVGAVLHMCFHFF